MHAISYVPAGRGPHPTAILLHGFPGNERNLDLAQTLRRSGWTVLFFHYRGSWGSGGAYSLGHMLDDVEAAVAFASDRPFQRAARSDPQRIALVGHSMGGFGALVVGSEDPRVDCVVSIAGANVAKLAAPDEATAERVAERLHGNTAPLAGTSGTALVQEINANVESAPPRHRVAVNLQGIEREQLERGMVLAPEKAQITTSVADVMLRVLQNSPVPLEDGQRVRVHHGTMERLARLRLPQRAPIEPGKRQAAQIRFEQPIAALVGDRFIVRRYSPVATLAGGVIADLQPPRWRRDDERWPTRAQVLADGDSSERIRLLVREAGVDGLLLAERSWQLGLDPESADRIATQLGAMRVFGASRWVGDDALAALDQAIESELSHYHAAEPLGRGLSVEILRARVAGNWDNESFRDLVNHFEQQNVLRLEAGFVIQASHQSSLGADEELALSRAIERLDQLGLDASDAAVLGEVTGLDGGALESVLQFASRQGRLVQLTDKRWLSAGVWSQIVETLRRECGEGGDLIDVSTFKSLFEISRRNAIPLLETLDEQRVTRRVGNARKLILDEPSG